MKLMFFPVILCLLFACDKTGKKEENSLSELKDQVMDIHDEVMPKMGELRKTQKQLLMLADSIKESDSLLAAGYRRLAFNIDEANESMMKWMRNYEPDYQGTEAEVRTYLEARKNSIEKVKADMLNSLKEGKEALEEF